MLPTLTEEDLALFDRMAERYQCSKDELLRAYERERLERHYVQLRLSPSEYSLINRRSSAHNVSITQYLNRCLPTLLTSTLPAKEDVCTRTSADGQTRTLRISLVVPDSTLYAAVQALAKQLLVPLSSLLRYAVLTNSMEDLANE